MTLSALHVWSRGISLDVLILVLWFLTTKKIQMPLSRNPLPVLRSIRCPRGLRIRVRL